MILEQAWDLNIMALQENAAVQQENMRLVKVLAVGGATADNEVLQEMITCNERLLSEKQKVHSSVSATYCVNFSSTTPLPLPGVQGWFCVELVVKRLASFIGTSTFGIDLLFGTPAENLKKAFEAGGPMQRIMLIQVMQTDSFDSLVTYSS